MEIFFGKGQRVFKKWMEFTIFGRMFRGVREVPKIFVSKHSARVVRSFLLKLALYGCRLNVVHFGRKLLPGPSTKQCVGEIMNGGEEGISP